MGCKSSTHVGADSVIKATQFSQGRVINAGTQHNCPCS